MKTVDSIPPKHRPSAHRKPKGNQVRIKPIKCCPMCGMVFFQNHPSRIYCCRCSLEREKEAKRRWAKEHPESARKHSSNYRARHMKPIPTTGHLWDLIFGYVEDESFEHGVYDGLLFAEDKTFASWYAERHKYE